MKILFIGDVYGETGRSMLKESLPILKKEYKYDFLIVNGENSSNNGRGIDLKIYKEFMSLGVNCITMGNHVWGNKDIFDFIDESNIVRPLNFFDVPGQGYKTFRFNEKTITVINLLGRVFMNMVLDCPFQTMDKILEKIDSDYIFIDFHAEATSEKVALGWYLDGRVDAIVGTHTHVPTADNRVLPKKTLYITDVGMTGALNGVIGVSKDVVVNRFIKGYNGQNKPEYGPSQLNGVILDLKNKKIERISLIKE